MSLIFDGFPDELHAHWFADAVAKRWRLETWVFTDEKAAYEHDPFPYALTPPIVHVERYADEDEAAIERAVATFEGRFAGT